ncbi:hypothetical protein [Bradyrhizobium sp. USDA 10063]
MGDQLLARAALATDQHRNLKRGHLGDLRAQTLHRRTSANDRLQAVVARTQRFGLALVEFEFAFKILDASAQCLELLRSLEHDASNRAKHAAVPPDRNARHDAICPAHPLNGSDVGLSCGNNLVQARILDHLFDGLAVAFAKLESEKRLMDRRNENEARLVIDDRHRVVRIGQQILDDVPSEIHAADEVQEGIARRVADHEQLTVRRRREQNRVDLAIQVERRQATLAQLIQPGAIGDKRFEPRVRSEPRAEDGLALFAQERCSRNQGCRRHFLVSFLRTREHGATTHARTFVVAEDTSGGTEQSRALKSLPIFGFGTWRFAWHGRC